MTPLEAQRDLQLAQKNLDEINDGIRSLPMPCQVAITLTAASLLEAVVKDSSRHHVSTAIHLVSAQLALDAVTHYMMNSASTSSPH